MEAPEPSDQLPEEGPAEQVPDDDGGSQPEEGGGESRDADEQATGDPRSAG